MNLCYIVFVFPLEIVSNKKLENTWRQLALEAIVTLAESGKIKNLSLLYVDNTL